MTLISFTLFGLGFSLYLYPRKSPREFGYYFRLTEVLYGVEFQAGRLLFSLDTEISRPWKG